MCWDRMFDNDIRNLANRFYKERGQNAGSDLEDWLKAKNVVYRRVVAGLIYLGMGISLTQLLTRYFLGIYGIEIFWCIGWSMIGVAAGLINTRNSSQKDFLHLAGYWFFVSLVVSIASFVISLYVSGEDYLSFSIKFYSLAALLSLLGGFLGDIFRDLVLKIINKKT